MGNGMAPLVILPLLISGYLFNLIFYPTRYFSARADGQRLFYMAAVSGLVINAMVFFAVASVRQESLFGLVLCRVRRAIPLEYSDRLIMSVLVSVLIGVLLNFILNSFYWARKRIGKEVSGTSAAMEMYGLLIQRNANAVCQLFRTAAEYSKNQQMVMISLKSRKVYCGLILEVPLNIENVDAAIEILPIFSSYREKDTLEIVRNKITYRHVDVWIIRQSIRALEERINKLQIELHRESDGPGRKRNHFSTSHILRGVRTSEAHSGSRVAIEADIAECSRVKERLSLAVKDHPLVDIRRWVKVIPVKEIETASFFDDVDEKDLFSLSAQKLNAEVEPQVA